MTVPKKGGQKKQYFLLYFPLKSRFKIIWRTKNLSIIRNSMAEKAFKLPLSMLQMAWFLRFLSDLKQKLVKKKCEF